MLISVKIAFLVVIFAHFHITKIRISTTCIYFDFHKFIDNNYCFLISDDVIKKKLF